MARCRYRGHITRPYSIVVLGVAITVGIHLQSNIIAETNSVIVERYILYTFPISVAPSPSNSMYCS